MIETGNRSRDGKGKAGEQVHLCVKRVWAQEYSQWRTEKYSHDNATKDKMLEARETR